MLARLGRGFNDDDDDIFDLNNNNNVAQPGALEEENENNMIFFPEVEMTRPKLTFEVTVTCPMHLAPWYILDRYNFHGELGMVKTVQSIEQAWLMNKHIGDCPSSSKSNLSSSLDELSKDIFNMSVIVNSTTAQENRLPFKYKYTISQNSAGCATAVGEDLSEIT